MSYRVNIIPISKHNNFNSLNLLANELLDAPLFNRYFPPISCTFFYVWIHFLHPKMKKILMTKVFIIKAQSDGSLNNGHFLTVFIFKF